MKRKTLMILTVLLIASLLASGSKAYFYAEGKATNVINSGNIDIKIYETTTDNVDGAAFPSEVYPMMFTPDSGVDKFVFVKNEGDYTAWIRVKITMSASDGIITNDDPDKIITPQKLVDIVTLDGVDDEGGADYKIPALWYDEAAPQMVSRTGFNLINISGNASWYTKNDAAGNWDGWYYFKDPVPPGGYTDWLITRVNFSDALTEEFFGETVSLAFDAQGVQYVHNEDNNDTGTDDVLGALGWE